MTIWKTLAVCAASLALGAGGASAEPTTTKVRITGLFVPDREKDLRILFELWPELKIVGVDFAHAEATLSFDAEKVFPKAKAAEVIAKLDERVRNASTATFGVKPISGVPRDKLQRVEIAVAGLDCKACCLGAYEIVAAIDGVEQATASFKDGKITARIDPAKTDRAKLEAALKQRGVTVR